MAIITRKIEVEFDWSKFDRSALNIGDEITETLKDGREVMFVVMDDGVIGLKNLLGYHCMNKEWTNEGGWLKSDMRRYLNEEVVALLPDDMLAAIKPRRFGEEGDKLWLFSEMEIFGKHIWGCGDKGNKQLEYFKDSRNRIKFDEDGDAYGWWERSPRADTSNHFCAVYSDGASGTSGACDSWDICFGFYI